MSSALPFVDWSQAPEGTTHVCYWGVDEMFVNGIPDSPKNWEKWVKNPKYDGSLGMSEKSFKWSVFEWDFLNNDWSFYTVSNGSLLNSRLAKEAYNG